MSLKLYSLVGDKTFFTLLQSVAYESHEGIVTFFQIWINCKPGDIFKDSMS